MTGSTLEVAPHPAAADSCAPAGGRTARGRTAPGAPIPAPRRNRAPVTRRPPQCRAPLPDGHPAPSAEPRLLSCPSSRPPGELAAYRCGRTSTPPLSLAGPPRGSPDPTGRAAHLRAAGTALGGVGRGRGGADAKGGERRPGAAVSREGGAAGREGRKGEERRAVRAALEPGARHGRNGPSVPRHGGDRR